MIVATFEPSHAKLIDIQEAQRSLAGYISPEYVLQVAVAGPAISVFHGEQLLGCAGIAPFGFGGAALWGMIAKDAGKHFIAMHRIALRFLDACPVRRLEASVAVGFESGCRWLQMLGFHSEGIMREYIPGEDYVRYARLG